MADGVLAACLMALGNVKDAEFRGPQKRARNGAKGVYGPLAASLAAPAGNQPGGPSGEPGGDAGRQSASERMLTADEFRRSNEKTRAAIA
jgi:hypothetical protein